MSRTVCIVQARLGSSRLPYKVIMNIRGKRMLRHVIERVREIRGVDDIGLTIPNGDLQIFNQLHFLDSVWIGLRKEEDVLGGYASLAREMKADVVLRVTGDCPLIDPDLCNDIRCLVPMTHSYASLDTRRSGFPDGLDCEAFTMDLLTMTNERATDPHDREHVTTWMRRAYSVPGTSPYPVLCREQDEFSKVKLSVDEEKDLDFVRRIMARIPAGDYSWKATQEAILAERLCV